MQEHWSRLPFPSPGDLLDPGIKPTSPASPVLAGGFFTTAPPWKPILYIVMYICQSQSPNSSHHHPFPTRCPYVCSLCVSVSCRAHLAQSLHSSCMEADPDKSFSYTVSTSIPETALVPRVSVILLPYVATCFVSHFSDFVVCVL